MLELIVCQRKVSTTPLLTEAYKRRATPNSLPKIIRVAKEAVSAAWQSKTCDRSGQFVKPNDAPRTKPRPCVKTMLSGDEVPESVTIEESRK